MKKYLAMIACVLTFGLGACSEDDEPKLGTVNVLVSGINNVEDIEVTLSGTSSYSAKTDAEGIATFSVPGGLYEASVTGSYIEGGEKYVYNGVKSQINVTNGNETNVELTLKATLQSSVLIIKEVYNGGCQKDNGGNFQFDKSIVLYNNSSEQITVSNLCVGMASPYNGHATNNNYDANGKLVYESLGFTPAISGIWWFQQPVTVAAYDKVVICVHGAIDNTQTVSASVNYANKDYYCMYDPESGYNLTSYYPTPADVIPTDHYLKAKEVGMGTGWPLSVTSPAVFIFQTKGVSPETFANETSNLWYDGGNEGSQVFACLKVPNEWILDGVEIYQATKKDDSTKRLTADIDGGYALLTNYLGHTTYRNVDKEATEALEENSGKLVYNYALGVDNSTDPSGIDAEASIKNGAHIVYIDTNNSTTDFHERQKSSLRD